MTFLTLRMNGESWTWHTSHCPWMAIRKEIRNRKCFCSWCKLSTCLSHSKAEFGSTLLEYNGCKSGAIQRSPGPWISNPLFFFPVPLLKSKHIFNGRFVVWVAFGFLSALFFLMWLDYIRYELPCGWKPTPDYSLSQSLKPDRGMPSLCTGVGLFLERVVFVPASLKIDLLKQNGPRSSQSRTSLETGVFPANAASSS